MIPVVSSHAESVPDFTSTVSKEFCDWYFEEKPSTESSFDRMNREIENNQVTQYFLSKFSGALYVNSMTEDSLPPRLFSYHIYENDKVFATLDYFYVPCHYPPFPTEFVYHDKDSDIDISITMNYDACNLYYFETADSPSMNRISWR